MLRATRRRNPRRRPAGVILQGRPALGYSQWDDEIREDGGKALLHRAARHNEHRAWTAEAAVDIADAREDGLLA